MGVFGRFYLLRRFPLGHFFLFCGGEKKKLRLIFLNFIWRGRGLVRFSWFYFLRDPSLFLFCCGVFFLVLFIFCLF